MGTFKEGSVVWIGTENDPERQRLANFIDELYMHFFKAGIVHEPHRFDWTPHITIMKTSKANGSKEKIVPDVYAEHSNRNFGVSIIEAVELSAMARESSHHYYPCHGKLFFDPIKSPRYLE